MSKQLLYFLLLAVANTVILIIFSALDVPKGYYIGTSTLLAGIYGGFSARIPRTKKN